MNGIYIHTYYISIIYINIFIYIYTYIYIYVYIYIYICKIASQIWDIEVALLLLLLETFESVLRFKSRLSKYTFCLKL